MASHQENLYRVCGKICPLKSLLSHQKAVKVAGRGVPGAEGGGDHPCPGAEHDRGVRRSMARRGGSVTARTRSEGSRTSDRTKAWVPSRAAHLPEADRCPASHGAVAE